jgi:predicted PurR-regulated permease PerM
MGVELDDTVDKTAHFALTSLCGSRLADTVVMPLALFLFCYQGDPVWQQHFEAVSDPEGPHYHAGMATMAEYAQGLFNLQYNTSTIVVQ